MSYATHSRFGTGYSAVATSENSFVIGSQKAWRGERKPLVYCHGSGGTATTAVTNPAEINLLKALAQDYLVIAADLALQAWGNDNHLARIGDAVSHLANFNADGPVTLVAGSMGNLGAFGYLKANPTGVRAIAGIIPCVDLDSVYPMATADINAAYGGAYNTNTHGPVRSPVRYATELNADVPVHLFTASNDTLTLPSTATAFVAARPQTERTNLGALGHTNEAVTASITPTVNWLKTLP